MHRLRQQHSHKGTQAKRFLTDWQNRQTDVYLASNATTAINSVSGTRQAVADMKEAADCAKPRPQARSRPTITVGWAAAAAVSVPWASDGRKEAAAGFWTALIFACKESYNTIRMLPHRFECGLLARSLTAAAEGGNVNVTNRRNHVTGSIEKLARCCGGPRVTGGRDIARTIRQTCHAEETAIIIFATASERQHSMQLNQPYLQMRGWVKVLAFLARAPSFDAVHAHRDSVVGDVNHGAVRGVWIATFKFPAETVATQKVATNLRKTSGQQHQRLDSSALKPFVFEQILLCFAIQSNLIERRLPTTVKE